MIYLAVTSNRIFINDMFNEVVYDMEGLCYEEYNETPPSFQDWKKGFSIHPCFFEFPDINIDITNWEEVKKIIPPELFL